MQANSLQQTLIQKTDYSNNILDHLDKIESNLKVIGGGFTGDLKSMFASEIRSAQNIPSANAVKFDLGAKWLAFGCNAMIAYCAYQKEDESQADTITDGVLAATVLSTGVEALSGACKLNCVIACT